MLILFYSILFLLSFLQTLANSSGITITLSQEMLNEFAGKYAPSIIEEVNQMIIPDTTLPPIDRYGTITTVYISNVKFNISNIHPEQVNLTLKEPSTIQINIENMKVNGNCDLSTVTKAFFADFNSTTAVYFQITKLDVEIDIGMSLKESEKVTGNFLPIANVTKVTLSVIYDFQFKESSLFFDIIELVKKYIKEFVDKEIHVQFPDIIKQAVQFKLDKKIEKIPQQVLLLDTGLAVETSLLEEPTVENCALVIKCRGMLSRVHEHEHSQAIVLMDNNNENNWVYEFSQKMGVYENRTQSYPSLLEENESFYLLS